MSIKTFAGRIANDGDLCRIENFIPSKMSIAMFFIGSQGNWPVSPHTSFATFVWPPQVTKTRRRILVHWGSFPCGNKKKATYAPHYMDTIMATLYLRSGTGQSFIVHTKQQRGDVWCVRAAWIVVGDHFISVRVVEMDTWRYITRYTYKYKCCSISYMICSFEYYIAWWWFSLWKRKPEKYIQSIITFGIYDYTGISNYMNSTYYCSVWFDSVQCARFMLMYI